MKEKHGEEQRCPISYTSNERTFEAARRLREELGDEAHIAALNFASAKNPGGGFLKGSIAQEECLACASGLYASLTSPAATPYYEAHTELARQLKGAAANFYSSRVIFSPAVPVFRGSDYALLEKPFLCSVLTCPAVNMSIALRGKGGVKEENMRKAKEAMRQRAIRVIEVAVHHGVDALVLGAWGCGVFRNDPKFVAKCFCDALKSVQPPIEHVVFAVPNSTTKKAEASNYEAFAEMFGTLERGK